MYTVGQVAKFLGISRDTLKFYEEKNLINPRQDEENGYRKYDLIDISEVMIINFFRDIDIEIKKIQEIKNGKDLKGIDDILKEKQNKIEEEIEYKKILLNRIEEIRDNINDINENLEKFTIREMKPMLIKKEIEGQGDMGELLTTILENHDYSGRMKKAVSLTGMCRFVHFDDNNVLSEKYGFFTKVDVSEINGEALTGNELFKGSLENKVVAYEKCLYFVVGVYLDSNDKNIDGDILAILKEKAREQNVELMGVSYVNLLFNGFKKNLGVQYLEIYTPVK